VQWVKIEIISVGGHSGTKKRKRGYGGAYGRVWRSLVLAAVWSQVVGFVLLHLTESGFSRHEGVFTFDLLLSVLQSLYFKCDLQR
jgi:hypothetical protein